jgi:chemotaxis signal transduction protein
LLELPEAGPASTGYIVLVRKQDRMTALRVDCLETTRLISLEELTASSGEAGNCFRFLTGLTPDKVRLLNTEALLAHPVFGRCQESAAGNHGPENSQSSAPMKEPALALDSRLLRGEITS